MRFLNRIFFTKSLLLLGLCLLVSAIGDAYDDAEKAINGFSTGIDRNMLESASSLTNGFLGEKVYYQAENARTDRVMITAFHNGYEGSGYGDYGGLGASLSWDIVAPVAGTYEIATRYASASSRPLELLVDGKSSGSFVIPATKSWRTWFTESIRLPLDPGPHTLTLLASASKGPNVDWVYVQSPLNSEPTDVPTKAPTVPTPPTPVPLDPVYYQPEQASSNRAVILYKNRDYDDGNGYADYLGNGSFLLWGIDLPTSGNYEVTVRYSAKSSRSAALYVDDEKVDVFSFSETSSWHTWDTESKIVYNLSQGTHSLMLRADDSAGPNVDWLSMRPLSTPVPVTSNPTKEPTSTMVTSTPTRAPTTSSPTKVPTGAPVTASPVQIPTETVFYQPEDAKMNEVLIKKNNAGYEGNNGFADFQSKRSYLLWSVSAPLSGNYEITVRYAARDDRPSYLLIDGAKVDEFDFSRTDSWRVWKTETRMLYLEMGNHSLMVLAAISAGPNLDWLSLRFVNPSTPSPVTTNRPTTLSPTRAPTTSSPTISTRPPTSSPTNSPSRVPTRAPITSSPTKAPIRAPVSTPSPIVAQPTGVVGLPPSDFAEVVVLSSGAYLSTGQFVSSPNENFRVGLTNGGNLVLQDKSSNIIWSSQTNNGHRLYMQSDGNLILRTSGGKSTWKSKTYNNRGARFLLDDGGQIAVVKGTNTVWLDGVPRGFYNGPSSSNLGYPLRGIFYYPWYPETWTIGGQYAHHKPTMGYYSSSDPAVADSHLDSFEYAHIDVAIASWWGPETNLDRARLLMRMDETIKKNSDVKWTIYYEDEMKYDPSIEQIRADLAYLKKWFAWHPAWAHIDGKPVIFIWNESDCEVVKRWMEAGNGEWYIITKLFGDYDECPVQPSHWHQYGAGSSAGGKLQYDDVSFTIAAGFWRADETSPRFPRLSERAWCQNVEEMVASAEPWQLIVSFNEAGEGTMIESSPDWASDTKYGYYLDCLNKYH